MVAGMRTAVVTGRKAGSDERSRPSSAGAATGSTRPISTPGPRRRRRPSSTAGTAARAAAELGASSGPSALDVRDGTARRLLADRVASERSLDLWVNNAGVFLSGPPWEQSAEVRQLMLDVNFTGLMMWDARRRQRRYKKKIESGRWP